MRGANPRDTRYNAMHYRDTKMVVQEAAAAAVHAPRPEGSGASDGRDDAIGRLAQNATLVEVRTQ